ncbi:hemolysin-III related-domain-containing protein [Mycena latifolia]|nr:hemolysin-III related-domain-containing protein [Mycena latifolia]
MSSKMAMASSTLPSTSSMTSDSHPPRLRRRRMSAPVQRYAPPRPIPPCRPLPLSLDALDLSPASPAQALASLRFLVLSYLADLERRLSLLESKDAREWASTALDMLHAIRADVCSHLPDLGAHLPDIDFKSHLPDIDLKSHLPDLDLKSHLPDMDFDFDFDFHLPEMHLPDMHLPDLDLKSLVARWHDLDFSRPLSYVPTLSARLRGLHAHLAARDFSFSAPSFDFDFAAPALSFAPPPALAAFLADVDTFLGELPTSLTLPSLPRALSIDGPPASADDVARALAASDDGARLIDLADLPLAWHNNPFVLHGYRFIPLKHWPRLVFSIVQPHNETLNIHTHLVPLLVWGAAFVWGSSGEGEVARDGAEALFTLFALACLASSTMWHTMAGCAHQGTMETCARIDYVGIGWLIATSIATVVHHGYACAEAAVDATPLGHAVLHPRAWGAVVSSNAGTGNAWIDAIEPPTSFLSFLAPLFPFLTWFLFAFPTLFRPIIALEDKLEKAAAYHPIGAACLALCLACGVSGNVLPFCDWFNRVENRLWRLGFFVGISFSALAPLAGIAVLQGWGPMLHFVAPIGPSVLFYIIGLVVYAMQVPECFLPPRVNRMLDTVGAGSHAVWHVFIVLAMRAHRAGIREMGRAAGLRGCAAGGVVG